MKNPESTQSTEFERKLAEALEGDGSVWFDSSEEAFAWAKWAYDKGYSLPMARSPEQARPQTEAALEGLRRKFQAEQIDGQVLDTGEYIARGRYDDMAAHIDGSGVTDG